MLSSHEIRLHFTTAMSQMYQREVPQYAKLKSLVTSLNNDFIDNNPLFLTEEEKANLAIERHGAIRLGTATELATMRRLFAVMAMLPVDYYDLSVAGIPVHSTAFRSTDLKALKTSPFRVFTSLLRLDLIEDDALRTKAKSILESRNIFSDKLLNLIKEFEQQGGLDSQQAEQFVSAAIQTFRWHPQTTIDKETYNALNQSHRLIADIVSFSRSHINHLTPRTLDIDGVQQQLSQQGFKAKAVVEGPPLRKCPILLRQTSFIALDEPVTFSDGESGTHTARFGEIEQRGIALTPKGRALYDQLLQQAQGMEGDYTKNLEATFRKFPDSHKELHKQALAYYQYSVTEQPIHSDSTSLDAFIQNGNIIAEPIIYEDFLPVSAAGIFQSNLSIQKSQQTQHNPNQKQFEKELGASVLDSFSLYEKIQKESLDQALRELSAKHTHS